MQVMVIDFCRAALKNYEANSTEFNSKTSCPVIDIMPEQKKATAMGGTMRLGNYPCRLVPEAKPLKPTDKRWFMSGIATVMN